MKVLNIDSRRLGPGPPPTIGTGVTFMERRINENYRIYGSYFQAGPPFFSGLFIEKISK